MLKISVIVTTYNRPDALTLVLQALAAQKNLTPPPLTKENRHEKPNLLKKLGFFQTDKGRKVSHFEVIIADDGSTATTVELIKQLQLHLPYPLQHIWQEDKGFRAAQARNRAVAAANGHYLIFLDGDCIPQTDFIIKHSQLAERGYFVAGNRILLSEKFTAQVMQNVLESGENNKLVPNNSSSDTIWTWHTTQWLLPYLRRDINRLLPLLRLPDSLFRKRHQQKWQGAKTCNLAVWREDILKINGFDERFQGWGHEDAELVVRLLHSGVRRKEGRFAVPVLHLWHPEQDRSQEQENRQRLEQILKSTVTVAQQGMCTHKAAL
ncbi:MAG: glycosyl transferase family 2 [Candidatus Parabeggiatoa sp. nov. 1]|nr:MAG: glycosyl transferase family 2 [Gammaproteobacteria bacterium]